MPEVVINGCPIHYEVFGSGIPVVLTPGGRWAGYVQRTIAAELAREFQVVLWDRRNTDGKSGLVIAGDLSEADVWADDLGALIKTLNLAPCYLGEYAGCRTIPLLCLKHPELVKGLMLGWPSGGEAPAEAVPKNMYRPYMQAALRRGMQAVAETGHFADSIKQNPSNRQRLLALDPLEFVRQMAFWEAFFTTSADLPIAGCRADKLRWASIKIPAIVTGGVDPIHPTEVARNLSRLLPNCRYHDPVVTLDEWNRVFGVEPYPIVSDLQGARIAPIWRNFIREIEGLSDRPGIR
jgi:2-hydroxy-6-oxonona-2,4-dienedioate hydrolase